MDESVRPDPFLFYACAMISFLESRVETYVENLQPFFACDAEIRNWLHSVWLPEEAAHGKLMRNLVERQWPELNWQNAFKQFSAVYVPRCKTEELRASVSLEALARCVTETETSMIYRCMASYSKNAELAALLKKMSSDEVRHYGVFKKLHRFHERVERNSFVAKLKLITARTELVRDEDLALSFSPLNTNWEGERIFPAWSYKEFLSNTRKVMVRHFPYKEAKKMLFNPIGSQGFVGNMVLSFLSYTLDRKFTKHA